MYTRMLALVVLGCAVLGVPACSQCECSTGAEADAKPQVEAKADINWNQLKSDMDAVEVLTLLGEPADVKVTKINTTWFYSNRGAKGPSVTFDTRSMRVDRWRVPAN